MKIANKICLGCGRPLTVNEHGFLDCPACRQVPAATLAAASKPPGAAGIRAAAAGASRTARSYLKLFWPDFIALVAIAACTILLGELLLDMLRRNL